MTIPDEAVEAACAAYRSCDMGQRWTLEFAMRGALEAAAPYMLPTPEGVSEAEKRLGEFANERGAILLDRELPATKRDILAVLAALSSERERAERAEKRPGFYPPLMVNPLADNNREGVEARLTESYVRQQSFVQDQAALVWRYDLGSVLGELTWRRAQVQSLRCSKDQAEFLLALALECARRGRQDGDVLTGMLNGSRQNVRDAEARAQAAEAKVKELLGLLAPFLPIKSRDTPDYAVLSFGDHQTQAMTMQPNDWIALSDVALRWTEEASQGEGE